MPDRAMPARPPGDETSAGGVIDMHVHVFEPGFMPRAAQLGSARVWAGREIGRRPEDIVREMADSTFDPGAMGMLEDLDAAQVAHAVIMMLDPGLAYGEAERPPEFVLERYADMVDRSGGRLSAFAGIDPRRPDASGLLRKAVGELGFRGLKGYPPHGYHPYDPEPMALYRVAAELGIPVLFHAGYVQQPGRSGFANPIHLEQVQAELPELTIIIGHAGFDIWWRETARVVEGHDRTFLEFSQWDRVGRQDPARLLHVMTQWKKICGSHRMIFGSDHVSGPGSRSAGSKQKWWTDWLRTLPERTASSSEPFTAEDMALIMGGNARRILDV